MSICNHTRGNFDGFLDGALDTPQEQEINDHLDTCFPCRKLLHQIGEIEQGLRQQFLDENVPPSLWRRIVRSSSNKPPFISQKKQFLGIFIAASVVLVLGVISLPFGFQSGQPKHTKLADTVINEMSTFVVSRRALDYSNSNPQVLFNWFASKVDFTPSFPPVNKKNAVLLGGRLCNIMDKRVVSYMYQVEGKYVSLYIMGHSDDHASEMDASSDVQTTPKVSFHKVNGYVHLAWIQNSLRYALVANLSRKRMTKLAEELMAGLKAKSAQL